MKEDKSRTRQYYKGKFFIVFYDKDDEVLEHMFDNVRDILKYQQQEVNRKSVNKINVELYLALRRKGHFTRMLNGKLLRVYLIKIRRRDEIWVL